MTSVNDGMHLLLNQFFLYRTDQKCYFQSHSRYIENTLFQGIYNLIICYNLLFNIQNNINKTKLIFLQCALNFYGIFHAWLFQYIIYSLTVQQLSPYRPPTGCLFYLYFGCNRTSLLFLHLYVERAQGSVFFQFFCFYLTDKPNYLTEFQQDL